MSMCTFEQFNTQDFVMYTHDQFFFFFEAQFYVLCITLSWFIIQIKRENLKKKNFLPFANEATLDFAWKLLK